MNTQEEKPMKLISMVDFVFSEHKLFMNFLSPYDKDRPDTGLMFRRTLSYAKFLSQPLTLSMFVPVDEKGNLLSEPVNDFRGYNDYSKRLTVFQEAKDKVLFEGFSLSSYGNGQYAIKGLSGGYVVSDGIIYDDSQDYAPRPTNNTIEHLLQWNENLKLTPTAKNQIFQ